MLQKLELPTRDWNAIDLSIGAFIMILLQKLELPTRDWNVYQVVSCDTISGYATEARITH